MKRFIIFDKIKIALGCLYHIWYYILMLFSIIILSPWLYYFSKKFNQFPRFYEFARLWSAWILNGMILIRKVKYQSQISWDKPYIVVANHTSELDVMFCYRLVKSPTVFIGKKELASIPLFGFFFRRSSIIVDRKSLASKRRVMELATNQLNKGVGVCIYPEGGIPKDGTVILEKFKSGAFKLAIENGVDILPISFANNRKHLPDFLQGGSPGTIYATVHNPISVSGMTKKDIAPLSDIVHDVLLKELKSYQKKI